MNNPLRTLSIETVLDTFITVDDRNQKIIKLGCKCKEFRFKCLRRMGRCSSIKYWAVPCLHHKKVYDALISVGYSLKIPTTNIGLKKLTPKLKKEILGLWANKCAFGRCEEFKNLDIHRAVRGFDGGLYSTYNCRPLCKKHHNLVHEGEPKRK